MRLLLTTDTVGGVWTFTCELAQELLRRHHSVALVSFGRAPSADQSRWCGSMAARYGDAFLFRSSATPLEWMEDNADAYAGGLALVLDTAREFSVDLLHASQFCWGAMPGNLPRMITAHSDVMSWAACCRPDGLVSSEWLSHYQALVQRGLDRADAVVAPSAWMQSALAAHFRVPGYCAVIHNGRTVTDSPRQTERKLQAVSAGRLWDEGKGLEVLSSIDVPMPILVAGENSFENASRDTGFLKMVGRLNEHELFALFRSSSVYIATSIYEPFGLAPLEAARCGCAIVARNIPSLREIWGDAALFFEDAEELSSILHQLWRAPAILLRAQEMAERHARRFTAARMTDEYLVVYESLLQGAYRASSPKEEFATNVG